MSVENSAAGLAMLPGEVFVAVSHEKHHQYALARYHVDPGERRHIAVELAWCVNHSGHRVIEVRLDGRRIGELTELISQRYASLLRGVSQTGGRPGCVAVVQQTPAGLGVMLQLPRWTPPAAPPAERRRRGSGLAWFAAAAVVVVAMASLLAVLDANRTPRTDGGVSVTATSSSTTDPLTARMCDPNYRGACVPRADDVDCAGEGTGPVFVTGPIRVVGEDVYNLDPDKDGIACG
ncbi:MAG TPA: hypothetical protein VH969_03935 [Actinophytocola sp.]|uniref:hypothetical protein n=1 Tax=Actinophytocola sp. TaxID=1872138 RepID=UPI002F924980